MLDSSEAHHAVDVLRMKAGDRATVFNSEGAEAEVEIVKAGKQGVEIRKLTLHKAAPLRCRITLGQAVPKGKNMELIIEKATELGAAGIAPLLSERTVVRGTEDDHVRKQHKWQRVAVEACKQCGQNWLPRVQKPLSPKAFFESGQKFDLMLVASLQSDALALKSVLAESAVKKPANVLILVGPEGDFTPAEMSAVKSAGVLPITLGRLVLRSETAAIYALSVISYELQSKYD